MPKPGADFTIKFRYPRLTVEQEAFAKKTIASWLSTLGSDGETFRPGGLFYIAMNAGIMTGINRIGSENPIDIHAAVATACQEAHVRISRRGQYPYHVADEAFYDMFLGDIQEEDERFDKHGGAVHAAFNAFSTVLNQDPDWIILESETMYRH